MKRSKIYIFVLICATATLLAGCGGISGGGSDDYMTMEEIYAQGNKQNFENVCFEGSRLYCPAWVNDEKWFSIVQLDGLSVRDYKPCFSYNEGGDHYISVWNLISYEGNIYYTKMNWDTEEYGIYRMTQSGSDTEKILDVYGEFQIVDSYIYYTDWTEIENFFIEDGNAPENDGDCHLYRCDLDGLNQKEIISVPTYEFYVFDDYILCVPDEEAENDETERICLYTLDGKKKKTLTDRHSFCPIYNGEYVYFLSPIPDMRSDDDSLYYLFRVDINGNHVEKISDIAMYDFIISYDSIYFTNLDDQKRIYKMDLSGENLSLVVDREDCNIRGIFQGNEDILLYESEYDFYINNLLGTNEIELRYSF